MDPIAQTRKNSTHVELHDAPFGSIYHQSSIHINSDVMHWFVVTQMPPQDKVLPSFLVCKPHVARPLHPNQATTLLLKRQMQRLGRVVPMLVTAAVELLDDQINFFSIQDFLAGRS